MHYTAEEKRIMKNILSIYDYQLRFEAFEDFLDDFGGV